MTISGESAGTATHSAAAMSANHAADTIPVPITARTPSGMRMCASTAPNRPSPRATCRLGSIAHTVAVSAAPAVEVWNAPTATHAATNDSGIARIQSATIATLGFAHAAEPRSAMSVAKPSGADSIPAAALLQVLPTERHSVEADASRGSIAPPETACAPKKLR